MRINKRIIVAVLFITVYNFSQAQKREFEGYEKIKEERKEFITEGLELTDEQAEEFWPVYTVYLEDVYALMTENRKGRRKRRDMSEPEAKTELDRMIALKRQELELQLTFYSDLGKVLSAKQILYLDYRERKFHQKVIEKFRKGRSKREG